MVRRMKAVITQIESIVTPSGNSGHVVVPKAWIGKDAIVKLKEKETRERQNERSMDPHAENFLVRRKML
jgi:putative transposon-encoded protein